MIYEKLIYKENCLIDISNISFKESVAMIDYMNETSFLTESAGEAKISEIVNKIRKLEADIKNNNIDKTEFKEKLEDIYELIKSVGNIEDLKENNRLSARFTMILLSIVNTYVAAMMLAEGVMLGGCITAMVAIFMYIVSYAGINNYTYDNVYDILVRSESKFMLERKKALQSDDKDKLKLCDKLIEIIEDFKTKRRKEYKNQQANESASINESDKSDLKVYNFKQAVDEIDRYLMISYDWLKLLCSTTKAMIKKANSMTEKNGDKVCNDIIDMGKEANEKSRDLEVVNVNLADNLFKKWGKTFSSKYTPFGMEVRENFEKKLASFNDEIIEYLNKFYDEISEEVTGKKGSSIKDISNTLYEKMRKTSSVTNADRINGVIANWYNGHQDEYKFLENEIVWAKQAMNSAKIKKTLRYKVFSKFAK